MSSSYLLNWFAASTVITWTAFTVACSCSVARYMIQRKKFGRLLYEDYLQFTALVLCFAFVVTCFLVLATDLYTKSSNTNDQRAQTLYTLEAIRTHLFFLTLLAAKAVFLAMYWRLFRVSKYFRILWWISVAITVLFSIAAIFVQYLPCSWRISKYSEASLFSEGSYSPSWLIASCVVPIIGSSGVDVILIILPLKILYGLNTSRSKKLKLAPVFLLGLITIAIDLTYWILSATVDEDEGRYDDYIFLLQALEPPITVIVATLPTILFSGLNRGNDGRNKLPHEDAQDKAAAAAAAAALRPSQNRWLAAGRSRPRRHVEPGMSSIRASLFSPALTRTRTRTRADPDLDPDLEIGVARTTIDDDKDSVVDSVVDSYSARRSSSSGTSATSATLRDPMTGHHFEPFEHLQHFEPFELTGSGAAAEPAETAEQAGMGIGMNMGMEIKTKRETYASGMTSNCVTLHNFGYEEKERTD